MTKEEAMLRRAAVLAAGLALTACGGIAGGGAASAATPTLHVEPGSTWLAEPRPGGCELEIFSANRTFASEFGGAGGGWSGGGATIAMTWTRRTKGLVFDGTYTESVHGNPEYKGKFSIEGFVFKGELIKGTRC
jgi:hypothetical protein